MYITKNSFNWIKESKKIVEVRLYDEKRKKIRMGNIIIFKK